jgi:hypothetical protein
MVRLEIRPDRWDHLGAASTLLTLAGAERWRIGAVATTGPLRSPGPQAD